MGVMDIMDVYVCPCISMYVHVCLYMLSMFIYAMYVTMYVHVCLCMAMYVLVCLCMTMYVYV